MAIDFDRLRPGMAGYPVYRGVDLISTGDQIMERFIHPRPRLPPGDEIRPSLIGGFLIVTDTRPSYYNVFIDEKTNFRASVDMVRLQLKFDGEWVEENAGKWDSDETYNWHSKLHPGGYLSLWTFKVGDSSVSVGIGQMGGTCKPDMHKGFIEFNPNKVCGDDRFWRIFRQIGSVTSRATLKRYDFALDVPLHRHNCRLHKDSRMFQSVISNGITEYLGVKNTPGFVKVYDKAAELKLMDGVKLTRIEMTCDGQWTSNKIIDKWPKVSAWWSGAATRDWVRVLGLAFARLSELGEDIEPMVAMLGRQSSRPKVREFCQAPNIEVPQEAVNAIWAEAHAWETRI